MLPNTTIEMQGAEFWIRCLNRGDEIVLSSGQIADFNQRNIMKSNSLCSIENYEEELTEEKIKEYINEYKFPEKIMYNKKGDELTSAFYEALRVNINLGNVTSKKIIQYGITVRNTSLRSFPTSTEAFKEMGEVEFDRFQETGCQVAEPVIIMHESLDRKWYFIQMYNYRGWVRAENIAKAKSKEALFEYLNSKSFIVISGDYAYTQFNPYEEGVSYLRLDMGNRIPLEDRTIASVGNQSVMGNYVIKLPVRNSEGIMEIKHGLISKSHDINIGYLTYTRENILRQIFKLSGCRYGWGDSLNGRDCSSTVMYVYKTFGFLLPRNGDEQAIGEGISVDFEENHSLDERKKMFDRVEPGAVIFMPGHVMMYIGNYEHTPFMIHCFYGYGELKGANYVFKPINEVAVTSTELNTSSGALFINRFSSLLEIR